MGNRPVNRVDEVMQSLDPVVQRLAMGLQGDQQVEGRTVDDRFDLAQAQIEFPEEQDLLKPVDRLVFVITFGASLE